MKVGKAIVFLIPFDKSIASNHVRAKCLEGYASNGWSFEFLETRHSNERHHERFHGFYKIIFYILGLIKIKFKYKRIVAFIIKPDSLILMFLIRRILRVPLISDVNDPIHLFPRVGQARALRLFHASDHVIFESLEYKCFWAGNEMPPVSIVEDTPQFECVFLDFVTRASYVAWVGSSLTSEVLLEFIPHLWLFNKMGYHVLLLGASDDVNQALCRAGIKTTLIAKYDHSSLVDNLTMAQIAFVPMLNNELHELRGNLKAKVAMGCGCLTIATRNAMHERLIENGKSGFLFNSFEELDSVLNTIAIKKNIAKKAAFTGNCYVADRFTRDAHASKICAIADELIKIH